MKTLIGNGEVRRELRRRVPLEGGGFTTEPAGFEVGTIEIVADVAALLELLGERALKNRSGRAHLAGGAIVANVIKTRRESK